MSVLLLHLSDIHIVGADDTVLDRRQAIVSAVKDVDHNVQHCVIVVTGDIAYAGQEDQYLAALEFFTALRDELKAALQGVDVRIVMIPGNHDCDVSGSQKARELMISAVKADSDALPDAAMVEVCTLAQSEFFELRNALAGEEPSPSDRLYYESSIETADGRILFRCYNTAWMSLRKEEPGTLVYPLDRIPSAETVAAVVVSIFHHPYNWLRPHNGRGFRKRIEASSDVILTGHEHEFDVRASKGSHGETSIYIEGGALQESQHPGQSEFNSVLLDLKASKQKIIHFEYASDRYTSNSREAIWEDYQVNKIRSGSDFTVSDKMREFLDDLGLTIKHPSRPDALSLRDIFVYPDLREVAYRPRELSRPLKGEHLAALLRESGRVLVTGADKAGKTTLAKKLFDDLHALGFVPLYVDASVTKLLDGDSAPTEFGRLFLQQYTGSDADQFMQLDRDRRILIIDNYDQIKVGRRSLQSILTRASHFGAGVLLFADDIAQQVQEIVGLKPISEGRDAFIHYRIQQFGHVRRNELCERWFALDPDLADDEAKYARSLMQIKGMMDTAIGKNYLPAFPVVLLPMLQAQQYSDQVNLSASTYGYFYELLIKRALAIGATREAMDVKMGYLTELAYGLFAKSKKQFTEQEFRDLHSHYEAKQLIRVSFTDIEEHFRKALILEFVNGQYEFKYAYVYYYFVANYLRENLSASDIQSTIKSLIATIHEEDSANILLFLVHLSKDPFIIDEMLRHAAEVFKDAAPATLLPEESPFVAFDKSLSDIVYIDTKGDDARGAVLERLDAIEEARTEREQMDDAVSETQEFVRKLSVAFKTQQILGQILKNFPGTTEGRRKIQIASQCYGIGRRTLGTLLESVRINTDGFVKETVDSLRADDPHLDNEDLSRKARESLYGLTHMASFGIVRRTSHSVGSPHLGQVYELLASLESCPMVALISTSLRLDQLGDMPENDIVALNAELENNPLAKRVLWSLVATHMNLFDVGIAQKQRICAKLGMKYLPQQSVNPRSKLVSKG